MVESKREGHNIEEISGFLNQVCTKFRDGNSIRDLRKATALVIENMNSDEKNDFVNVAKKHFKSDFELNPENIEEFLTTKGFTGIEFHLKMLLGKKGWEDLELIETNRILEHDLYNGGQAG